MARLPSEVRIKDGAERNVTVVDRQWLASKPARYEQRRSVQMALHLAVDFAANRRCRDSGTRSGRVVSGRRMDPSNSHVDADMKDVDARFKDEQTM